MSTEYDKYFLYKDENITCKASLPQQLTYDTPEDMFADSLLSLHIKGKPVNIEFNLEKVRQIIDRLPPQIIGKYFSYIDKTNTKLNKVQLIDIPKEVSEQTFYLSATCNELVQFISLCFYLDLATTYQNEYQLTRNFKFTSQQINTTVPAELDLYYKFVKEEIKKSEQESKANKQPGTQIPSRGFGVD